MEHLKTLVRLSIIFFELIIIIRLLGKREIGQLSIFDLVILLIIADIGALGVENKELFIPAMLCLLLLLILQKLFSAITLHISSLRNFIDGKPRILIKNGVIQYDNLHKENYSIDDLISQMRNEGIMEISEIRLAVLETNGMLSIFSKKRYKDLKLPIIISGRIDKNMVSELNLTEEKIKEMLLEKNTKLKDVLYASSNGKEIFIASVYKS